MAKAPNFEFEFRDDYARRKQAMHWCDFLNSLMNLDPEALHNLIETRVACNDALRDHPSVQCWRNEQGQCVVGLLGILNGFIGTRQDGMGYLSGVFDEAGKLVKFTVDHKPVQDGPTSET
jgi:hypothetical protein